MSACIKSSDPDPIYILRSGPESVSSLTFAYLHQRCNEEEEEVLLSGSQDGSIQIWDLKSKRVRFKLQTSSNSKGVLYADVISLDNNDVIVSHTRNGCVQFWLLSDDGEWKVKKTLLVYEYGYCPIAVYKNASSHCIAYPSSGESEFSITTFDSSFDINPVSLKSDDKRGIVMQIKLFSREEKMYALIGYENGSVCLWDLGTKVLIQAKKLHKDPVMCLDIDQQTSKCISGSADNVLHVLCIDGCLQLQDYMTHDTSTSGFACACIRNDGCIVVCGGWDGKVRVFGWKKLKPLAILKFHTQSANIVCFSKGHLIAVASKDGRISIWDVYKDS